MRERRMVVRTWIESAPDGNSVLREEAAEVTVEWPDGFNPKEQPMNSGGYSWAGSWRILPKQEGDANG